MKVLTPVVLIAAFMGGCTASLVPVWNTLERLWINDIADSSPKHFPIVVIATNASPAYQIAWLNKLTPEQAAVTILSSGIVDNINRDLRLSVSTNDFQYSYFKILATKGNDTDVSLEVPTTHESKHRTWYRIRNDTIIPQREMQYGPGFAFFVIPFTALAGLASMGMMSLLINRLKKLWPNKAVRVPLPADGSRPPHR